MKKVLSIAITAVFLSVLVSGCTENSASKGISISNITTDKMVYHSSETLNLSLMIYSPDIDNITVSVSGINGRMDMRQIISVSKGVNEVSFVYTLPRCNICGGISPGDYNLTCIITYKNTTIEDSKIINIQQ